MSLECAHGSLARQCEICQRDEEIAELKAELARFSKEPVAFLSSGRKLEFNPHAHIKGLPMAVAYKVPLYVKTATLDDGFGNRWPKCPRPDCKLEIVRPGKAQCDTCSNAAPQGNDTDLYASAQAKPETASPVGAAPNEEGRR